MNLLHKINILIKKTKAWMKVWADTSYKKVTKMVCEPMNGFQHYISLGNCQLKQGATKIRHQGTPVRMIKSWKTDNTKEAKTEGTTRTHSLFC